VAGLVNDYADLISAYYAFKQGHVGDGLFSLGSAIPVIGTPIFKGIKWLMKADNVTDALRLLNKGEFLNYTDELGNVLDICKVDNGFEILDSTGAVLKKTDNVDGVTEAVEALYKGTGKTVVNYGDQYTKVGNKKVLKPDIEYVDSNGYKYKTDSNGRISNVQGDLTLVKGKRNAYDQRTVGGADRLPTDDGGHLIGSQFNASGQIDNLIPQNSGINKAGGEWYKMEQEWVSALDGDSTVKVDIKPNYTSSSV